MKEVLLQSRTNDAATTYDFAVKYYVFEQDGLQIAYCPSLDLSAYGDTEAEAEQEFGEIFEEHVNFCVEHGTLLADLEAHGWKVGNRNLRMPTFARLMKAPEMRHLMNSEKCYRRLVAHTRIPALA